jgi:hypothetical protein
VLPFKPETIEDLRARYQSALTTIFDIAEIEAGGVRPGQLRRHVFDCEDGIRLLISRDRDSRNAATSKPALHVSASVEKGYEVYTMAERGELSPEGFLRMAKERFASISGDPRRLRLLGFSHEAGVPHWMVEER